MYLFRTDTIIRNITIGVTNETWPFKPPIVNGYRLCGDYTRPTSAEWIRINCSLTVPPARFVVVHAGMSDVSLCICEIQVFGSNLVEC